MGLMRKWSSKKRTSTAAQERFQTALANENITLVQNLLINNRHEIDLEAYNRQGVTALHLCTLANNTTMLRVLISFDANINATDKHGWTSLHAAAALGYEETIKVLLKAGVDPKVRSTTGQSAIDVALTEEIRYMMRKYAKKCNKAKREQSLCSGSSNTSRGSSCASVNRYSD
ncbi:notch-regulated ankyrin repeat-containing protein A-like [Clytia hemisphaerica]|uniref:notch-regulated ankyrin repeat-containing protein A-like n=1 Tax=Clytia hemisphaerica TaxID=252671 RepID=UPI0034D4A343